MVFCKNKSHKTGNWFTIDVEPSEILGVFIGSRNAVGAQGLWNSLPPIYRQCVTVYTDFWDVYQQIISLKRYKSVDKQSGLTSKIERLNCTLRQRISRLVRKTLSFSKKLDNHIGAI